MVYEFFMFNSFWFWGLAGIEILVLLGFLAIEEFGRSTFSVVVFILLLCFFGDTQTIKEFLFYIQGHPFVALKWGFLYGFIGFVVAAAIMWYDTYKTRKQIVELKKAYPLYVENRKAEKLQNDKDISVATSYDEKQRLSRRTFDADSWEVFLNNNIGKYRRNLEVKNYRNRVVFWVAYWPLVGALRVIRDPFMDLAKFVYDVFLEGLFKLIHDRMIGSVVKYEDTPLENQKK